MDARADKIRKIRNLAERGATEGERAAAREALLRMEANEPESEIINDVRAAFVNLTNATAGSTAANVNLNDLLNIFIGQTIKVTHEGRVTWDLT